MRALRLILCGLAAACWSSTALATQGGGAELPVTVLLRDDSQYSGAATFSERGELRMEVDPYSEPATLDLGSVTSLVVVPEGVRWPLIPESGRDLLTLKRRQNLRGRLGSLTDGFVEFESSRFGSLRVPLGECGDLVPPALADTDGPARPLWGPWMDRNEGATEVQTEEDVLLFTGRGAVAARRCLDYGDRLLLELSWEGEPEFRVHLGGDPRRDPFGGVVVEAWDGLLVLYSFDGTTLDLKETELELEEDSSVLFRFDVGGTRVRLSSAEAPDGRVVVLDAELERPGPRDGVVVTALGKPMRLLRAEISVAEEPGADRVAMDRAVMLQSVLALDPGARTFQVAAGTVDFDRSQGLRGTVGRDRKQLDASEPDSGWYRVTCRDGEAVEARDLSFVPGGLRLQPRWSEEFIVLPIDDLWHLRQRTPLGNENVASGSLELEDQASVNIRLAGFEVVNGKPQPRLQVFGFKEPIAVPAGVPFSLMRRSAAAIEGSRAFPNIIVLEDGQRFPARVVEASPLAVTVETPFGTGQAEVAQDRIKAVLLAPGLLINRATMLTQHPFYKKRSLTGEAMDLSLKPSRMTRDGDALRLSWALAVPRAESASPGEQLFLARNGDLLRADLGWIRGGTARLQGGATAGIEVPLQRLSGWVRVDRDLQPGVVIAEGAWQFTLGSKGQAGRPSVKEAVLHGTAQRSEDGRLVLQHEDLGTLSIPTAQIRQIDHAARARRGLLPFDSWRSRPMRKPDAEGLLIEDR